MLLFLKPRCIIKTHDFFFKPKEDNFPIYCIEKKSIFWLLTEDIEKSWAGGGIDQQSQEHDTRYMDQDLQVKLQVQVTQNLIYELKSTDKNVKNYDTWMRKYRYLLVKMCTQGTQRASNSGSVKMVCKVRKNY